MFKQFAQLAKCLWCVWPALIIGIGWFWSKGVDGKTYFGALTPGVDPLAATSQAEFETQRNRDQDKKRIIAWCAGIIIAGYAIALLWNTFTLRASAHPLPTATQTATATVTALQDTPTPYRSPTDGFTATSSTTGTHAPTQTPRIVYQDRSVPGPVQVVTVIVERQIVITQVVTVEVTREVTPTFTPTATATGTPTETPTETPTVTP